MPDMTVSNAMYQLLPGLGWKPLNWNADLLPSHLRTCYWCGGHGVREDTYTAGCGGGYYRAKGKCDHCDGIGVIFNHDNPFVPDRPELKPSVTEIAQAVQTHLDHGIVVGNPS